MNCLNCDTPLEQIKGKREKQFCNSTCRSNYWQKAKRKQEKDAPPDKRIKDLTKPSNVVIPITQKPAKTNHVINTTQKNIPPIPERKVGENACDYAVRKNEWKRLYQK